MVSEPSVLPSSLLTHRPDLGSRMVDWPMPDGTTVRCECVQVFCANCGTPYGWVPKDNTTFAFWLCDECFKKHGPPPGTYVSPDDEFRRKLQEEMVAKHGRILTSEELLRLADRNELGPLALLLRETPYKEYRK